MSKHLRWYKRDVDAWRGGTRGMSLELRGFYSEILDAMWDRQGPLEKDVSKLAILLSINPRSVRKLLPQLIAMGKIVETPEGYSNERMMAEIGGARTAPIRREPKLNSAPIAEEFEPKVPKNPLVSTRDLEVEKDIEAESEAAPRKAYEFPPLPCDPKELSGKLVSAANGSIANPASFPGLLNMSIPLMWIEQGADLERDVLPTVAAIGAKKHGKGIRSWDYFTAAVAEAMAKRKSGLPTVRLTGDASADRQLREIALI